MSQTMMSATVLQVISACVLTWSSQPSIVTGQFGSVSLKGDLQPSSLVPFNGDTNQITPVVKLMSTAFTDNSATRTQTSKTADSVLSPTEAVFQNAVSAAEPASSHLLPTNEVIVSQQSSSVFTKINEHQLSVSNVTSHYLSSLSSFSVKWTATEVEQSFLSTFDLEPKELTALTLHGTLTEEATFLSSSIVPSLLTSPVPDGYSTELYNQSLKSGKTSSQSKDVQPSSATEMQSSSSVKFVSVLPSSTSPPATRSTPRSAPGKPSRAGASGEDGTIDFSGGVTPGAKIVIGIVVTLCILVVAIAGVVLYRRYNITHRSLKSFLTSGVRYKTYNNSTYKDDEVVGMGNIMNKST